MIRKLTSTCEAIYRWSTSHLTLCIYLQKDCIKHLLLHSVSSLQVVVINRWTKMAGSNLWSKINNRNMLSGQN